MKKTALLITILAAALFIVCAAGAVAPVNPERDDYLTCGSAPADFNGKNYEDLYVLLNGCRELNSSIIPEDNAFVTLRDINVSGTLYFVDDRYDPKKNSYTESTSYDSLTRANHYLNIAGNSYIENLYVECMNPHDCNVGIQYPAVVNNLYIVPTNAASRGRIAIRGYVAPLVDAKTNYYKDMAVESFPNFQFASFDREFAAPIVEKFHIFERIAGIVAKDGFIDGINTRTASEYELIFNEKYPYPKEIAVSDVFLHRGKVNNLSIYNKYRLGSGDMNIDLINLHVETAMITNGENIDSTTATDFVRVWTPVLRTGGFTNIGVMSVYSGLKTEALEVSENTLPLYIDAMVVGTEGLTEKITLASTKVAILNYLGGLSPYSVLTLKFVPPAVSDIVRHVPGIGMLMIHGGRVNLEADSYYRKLYYVGSFWIFSGRDDLRFEADEKGVSSAAAFLKLPVSKQIAKANEGNEPQTYDNARSDNREELFEKYNDNFSYDSGFIYIPPSNLYGWTGSMCTTTIGANWLANILEGYSKPAPENIKQAYTSKIWLAGVAFGDMNIDSALNEAIGSGWFSAYCAAHQYGEDSNITLKQNYIK